MTVSPELLS